MENLDGAPNFLVEMAQWIVRPHQLSNVLMAKGGSSSVVERQLPKLNVAGSIPVSRSNQFARSRSTVCSSYAPSTSRAPFQLMQRLQPLLH
jgi:hypothetical protein